MPNNDESDIYKERRKQLVEKIKSMGILKSENVINAFLKVPREKFVDDKLKAGAYEDIAMPIGYFQTISQPSTIATILELLDVKKGQNVLEIGSGCGYCAALLRELVLDTGKVTGIEYLKELAILARENIDDAGYDDVNIANKDGSLGHEEGKPYDRILVSAACPYIPKPLIDQLEDFGMIIAPVGDMYLQQLEIVRKVEDEILREYYPGQFFAFVPLRGKLGFSKDSY